MSRLINLESTFDDNDERYKRRLEGGSDVSVSKPYEVEKDNGDDDDPHLKMFMENLRADGISFVLKIDKNDGFSEFLKYEGLDESDDERDTENRRKSKGDIKREKVEQRKYLRDVQRRDEDNMKNFPGKERRDNLDNPKIFLGKERRNLEVRRSDNVENPKKKISNEKRNSMVQRKDNVENPKSFRGKERRKVDQRRDHVDNHNMEPQNNCDKEDDKFDSCYNLFFKFAEVEENYFFLVDNGKRLKYEEDDKGNSSDLEILEMDNAPAHTFIFTKVFNASVEVDDSLCASGPNENENPQFREKLMDVLKRPYNQEEYKKLLQEVKRRHLKAGPENSCGVKKTCPADTYSKCPLDYHTDFKKRLDAAQNDLSKRLNLLRGFLYWYEKSCQEGSFKPWLDKSCLTVFPRPH